jgi:hypothetical protein
MSRIKSAIDSSDHSTLENILNTNNVNSTFDFNLNNVDRNDTILGTPIAYALYLDSTSDDVLNTILSKGGDITTEVIEVKQGEQQKHTVTSFLVYKDKFTSLSKAIERLDFKSHFEDTLSIHDKLTKEMLKSVSKKTIDSEGKGAIKSLMQNIINKIDSPGSGLKPIFDGLISIEEEEQEDLIDAVLESINLMPQDENTSIVDTSEALVNIIKDAVENKKILLAKKLLNKLAVVSSLIGTEGDYKNMKKLYNTSDFLRMIISAKTEARKDLLIEYLNLGLTIPEFTFSSSYLTETAGTSAYSAEIEAFISENISQEV